MYAYTSGAGIRNARSGWHARDGERACWSSSPRPSQPSGPENNERDQLCQTGETGPLRPPAQPPPDTSVAAGRPSGAPAGAVTDERAPPGNHGRATAAMANYGQSQ